MTKPNYSIPTYIPNHIFRAYDIRGEAKPDALSPNLSYAIGRAIGTNALELGQSHIAIGRDGRLSSLELSEALAEGLLDAGVDVTNIGLVPTPLLYFATHLLETHAGVMVTGSHNPASDNGFKIVLGGQTLRESQIGHIRQQICDQDLPRGNFKGKGHTLDIRARYMSRVLKNVQLHRPYTIVLDCGNGAGSIIAPELFRQMGCQIISLYDEVDGRFPNHHPDPSDPANLEALRHTVLAQKADVGFALDGDGDRLGVVNSKAEIIWPDRYMMLFAKDLLTRYPGAHVLYDVKCTRHLARVIEASGGVPVMSKTGHAHLKAQLKDPKAMLAGEMSGHIFFKEHWYSFDDALYAGAMLVDILSRDDRTSSEVFSALPDSISTPELKIPLADSEKDRVMKLIQKNARFEHASISTLDGLRVDFEDGWGLVRMSNTTPCLSLRFEADNERALARIQQMFGSLLQSVDPTLELP